MKKLTIYQTDAFTDTLFGGNPTATVIDASGMNDQEMQRLANEMNHSETGYILPSDTCDFKLRFFSRTGDEIRFCGHATLGALSALEQDGRVPLGEIKSFKVETNAGKIDVTIDCTTGKPSFTFDSPEVTLEPFTTSLEPLDFPDIIRPSMIETGNRYLYLAVKDLETLGGVRPNMGELKAYCLENEIMVVCLLTPHAIDPKNHVHARGFGPAFGVPEDPFTGSMQAGLFAYCRETELINSSLTVIHTEQGHFLGRPGHATIEFDDNIYRLRAEAVPVFKTQIQI
jgi:trans-2,3-dihydro-3-hydroxyanthranilate isomerase